MSAPHCLALVLAAAPVGRIQGGWSYVWVSYGLTWTVLLGYGLSLFARVRAGAGKERP